MVAAVTMVKDEADVVEQTVGRMLAQVDRVYALDNGSMDGTSEILDRLGVMVLEDPELGYYQAKKLSALADDVRRDGAEWVIPFDADELWMCDGRIADLLEGLPDDAMVAEATVFDHVATAHDIGDDPVERMVYRRADPVPLRKVACRAVEGLEIHQGNHGANFPDVRYPLRVTGELEVRHFPYRSPEQFIRKVRNGAAAYAATDLPESTGSHWRQYGQMSDDALREHFHRWFWREDPTEGLTIAGERQGPLVYDPVF